MHYQVTDGELIGICYARNDELCHYGVKGMRWGHRKANPTWRDGIQAKMTIRADNKRAFVLGKEATISGHAASKSAERTSRLQTKLDRRLLDDPYGVSRRTTTLRRKVNASSEVTRQLLKTYDKNRQKAEDHCKKLIAKYGEQFVEPIKYTNVSAGGGNRRNVINERVTSLSEWVQAGVLSAVTSSAISSLSPVPIVAFTVPKNARHRAYDMEKRAYDAALRHN